VDWTAAAMISGILLQRCANFKRDAPDESDEPDGSHHHGLAMVFSLARYPPLFCLEDLSKPIGNRRIVFVAADFFGQRTGQTDNMVGRDPPFLSVEFRQFNPVRRGFVVDDNG